MRKIWLPQYVVDASGPHALLRTYLEQSDVRNWLDYVSQRSPLRAVCDVGAGYGRITPVLTEFAQQVVAFEREPDLVATMRELLPQVAVRQVESLSKLPANSGTFDFAMTFTVLQHLNQVEVEATVAELKRILTPTGYVLFCEATDPALRFDEFDSPEGGTTIGRTVEEYVRLMAPFTLVDAAPRRMEPTYTLHTGTYMLFGPPTN